VQLRLVVGSIEAQTAGEVDEDLLLVELAEHFGRGLQRGELAVGIEDIELGVILTEGRTGVGAAGVVRGFDGALRLANRERLQNRQQLAAIRREVLQDVDRLALVAQDRNQVGSGHLGAQKLLGGADGAQLVRRIHGRHVEVKGDQAAVLVALVSSVAFLAGGFRGEGRTCKLLVDADVFALFGLCGQRLGGLQVLVLAEFDSLRNTVFGDRKVLGGKAVNGVALLVFGGYRFDDQLGLNREREFLFGLRSLVLANLLGCHPCGGASGGEEQGNHEHRGLEQRSCPHFRTSGAAWFAGYALGWRQQGIRTGCC